MKKFLNYLSGFLPFFAAEGIQIAAAGILTTIYSLFVIVSKMIEGGLHSEADTNKFGLSIMENGIISQESIYLISVVGVMVSGIVFYFWYRQIRRYESKNTFHSVFTVKNICYLILLGLGCQFFISGFMGLIRPYFQKIFTDYSDTVSSLMSGSLIVVLLFTTLIAPITEELIFRGVILRKMKRNVSVFGAIVLQALLFGIYHWNVVQGIYAFIIGLLLGYVAVKFNNLLASIFLHSIINASAFLMVLFRDAIPIYISLFMFGAALCSLSIIKFNKLIE